MADLYDLVVQELKDKCSDINWKMGSLLRELLVEPLGVIENKVAGYINQLIADNSLNTALENPAEYESTLNSWMSKLNITAPEGSQATGSVVIVLSERVDLLVPQRASLSCGSVSLTTDKVYNVSADSLIKLSDDAYYTEIPVLSTTITDANIPSGKPVTWGAAPEQVTDIYVGSAITGGIRTLTAQDKANRISAVLSSGGLVGEYAIKSALINAFPDNIADVKCAGSTASDPYKSLLFIKQRTLPKTETVELSAFVDDSGTLSTTLTGAGIQRIAGVTVAGEAVEYTVTRNGLLGSANENIAIQISNPPTVPLTVSVSYEVYDVARSAMYWLNSLQRALPYQFSITVPAISRLRIEMDLGGAELDSETAAHIQAYICATGLDAGIRDSEISAILTRRGYNLKSAVVYSANISYGDASDIYSSAGAYNPAGLSITNGVPVATYSTIDDIIGY